MATDDNVFTVAERVISACNASSLQVDENTRGHVDTLIAMGWSKHQFGTAVLRLSSEYDSVAKPKPLSHDEMVRLVLTYKADKRVKRTTKECETLAKIEAAKWHANEKALFLPRLKTLPAVIQHLTGHAAKWQIQEPQQRATVSIGYWLDQTCDHCHGLKLEVIPDTPVLSEVPCKPCQGTGKKAMPYGQIGRRLVGYLDECSSYAARDVGAR